MAGFFRAHVETAITRFRQARRSPVEDTAHFTIGFVDLVGYSKLSRRMTASELGTVIDRFEDTAHAVATVRGGRVVKLVGDEVMFVTLTAAAGCDIALALVERFAHDPSITPRGGLASGEVLPRGGDYYGPTVNLAARLAEIAVPGELLVTPEVAAEAGSPELRFEPAGKRLLKGFEEPVTLLTVERPRAATKPSTAR
jgi:adenylate cyclase